MAGTRKERQSLLSQRACLFAIAALSLLAANVCAQLAGDSLTIGASREYKSRVLAAPVPEAWLVTTVAGMAGERSSVDGVGFNARFDFVTVSRSPFLWHLSGIALDAQGNLYVVDSQSSTIRIVRPDTSVSTLAGAPYAQGSSDGIGSAARFTYPSGVAVNSRGIVFVADRWNHTIRRITQSGEVSTFAGSAGVYGSSDGIGSAARFNHPSGLAFDRDDYLYVADRYNNTIRRISPTGEVTTVAAAVSLQFPSGVAIDSAGNIVVADTWNNAIRRISPGGEVTTLAGTFSFPSGVAADAADNVYVSDCHSSTIIRISPDGDVATLAGSTQGSSDGVGSAAEFTYPTGITVTPDGRVFVVDTWNFTVRRLVDISGSCTYSISPTSQSFFSAAGSGTVTVTAGSGCSWTAASNAGWISVTSGASGSGNGTVGYSVQANAGAARSGTLTIAGHTLTVSQGGASCSYSINPMSGTSAAGGGTGSFNVSAGAGCAWTASSDSSWLRVTAGASGSGNGTVSYGVDANGGGARAGHITVQGQSFTLNQSGTSVSLPYSHWIAAASHVDGAGSSHWRSDVAVLNRSASQATVEYRLYTPAGVRTQQVALAGNAQDFRKDIAAWLGYTTGSGPLEVRSSQDVFVMGRTYNQVDATRSYGQNYDGQDPGSSLLSAGQSAWLPLLAQTPSFRCNIAITNSGTTTANVTLALYDGQGNLLWSGNAESDAITAGGFIQYLKPFQKYAGRNNIEHGYAKVTVNSGSGIIVWASVVDEASGDPTTIFMKR